MSKVRKVVEAKLTEIASQSARQIHLLWSKRNGDARKWEDLSESERTMFEGAGECVSYTFGSMIGDAMEMVEVLKEEVKEVLETQFRGDGFMDCPDDSELYIHFDEVNSLLLGVDLAMSFIYGNRDPIDAEAIIRREYNPMGFLDRQPEPDEPEPSPSQEEPKIDISKMN